MDKDRLIQTKLYNEILSDHNIYKAIYALQSYVYEKGLLKEEDIQLYNKLTDKFDFNTIDTVTIDCEKRLEDILTNKNAFFNADVYFRLKKFDEKEGKPVFRPMHTATLIDQICMVCMLQPLMYNDDNTRGLRRLSDLSTLFPHNFYGNMPSTHPEWLFCRWQEKYREYSDKVISRLVDYKKTHEYESEISLDIKEFFPSIDPCYIAHFIVDKLAADYVADEREILNMVVTKLLYCTLDKKLIEPWVEEYYGKGMTLEGNRVYMTRGITQGLPQSYFFGNLCMTEVAKEVKRVFDGDSYYYVDDSVIYVKDALSYDDFNRRLSELNTSVSKMQQFKSDDVRFQICRGILSAELIGFQKKLDYTIQYHEDGKSTCCSIDESKADITPIRRQVSLYSSLGDNADDDEDQMSLMKVDALVSLLENEIGNTNRKKDEHIQINKKAEEKGEDAAFNIVADDTTLKLLKRYRRYFLFRKKLLLMRDEGKVSPDDFLKTYKVGKDSDAFWKHFEEDIFKAESELIVGNLPDSQAQQFIKDVSEIEANFAEDAMKPQETYYFTNSLRGAIWLNKKTAGAYNTLEREFRYALRIESHAQSPIKWRIIRYCMLMFKRDGENHKYVERLLKRIPLLASHYVAIRFLFFSSEAYRRRIFNAMLSTLLNIDVTDGCAMVKNNHRAITYREYRLLMCVRNKSSFSTSSFIALYERIYEERDNLLNDMYIDARLQEAAYLFITKVRKIEYVDDLIVIHRLVGSLWKNGSKFLYAYTLHNEEHAITLIQKSMKLLKVLDVISMKRTDYYILFLACYLHDISMVKHPAISTFNSPGTRTDGIVSDAMSVLYEFEKKLSENKDGEFGKIDIKRQFVRKMMIEGFEKVYNFFEDKMRSSHPEDSAEMILTRNNYFGFLTDSTRQQVAKVSASHGYDSEEVYGRKSDAHAALFSIKYMMILIRLADLMDMANDRVNLYLLRENFAHLSLTSRFHWISHLVTDGLQITSTYDTPENALLDYKVITQNIRFNIFLNTTDGSTIGCKGCMGRQLSVYSPDESQKRHRVNDERMNADNTISLTIAEKEHKCTCEACRFTCRWMNAKHGYLFHELSELLAYIGQQSNSLFDTKIQINFSCPISAFTLDQEFKDSVRDYLDAQDN